MIKKTLIIALVVAILALPMFAVSAKKTEPTTTLTGTFWILPGLSPARSFPAGESGHQILKWRNLPGIWEGDIVAGERKMPLNTSIPGSYGMGNWVIFNIGGADEEVSTVNMVTVEDASVAGIGSGDLKIFLKDEEMRIISGTGDLKGIKGTGTFDPITPISYSYELMIQMSP
jgi:hypothetical protein